MTKYQIGDKLLFANGVVGTIRGWSFNQGNIFYDILNSAGAYTPNVPEEYIDDDITNGQAIFIPITPPKYNIGDKFVILSETLEVISLPYPVYYGVKITTNHGQSYSAVYHEETLGILRADPQYQYIPVPTQATPFNTIGAAVRAIEQLSLLTTHKDHDTTVSSALGKEFNYCRTCKVEFE